MMMNIKHILGATLALAMSVASCTGAQQKASNTATASTTATVELEAQPFDADSAYSYIEAQVAFGPRVPGSRGHQLCGDWIANRMRGWGYTVSEQPVQGTDYYGKAVAGRNIIASLAPQATDRILLMAHWDTRPVADHDANPSRRDSPILGADDGGSGVAVLLEIARQWQSRAPGVGVDFVFFDLEDGGHSGDDDSWCQGSQHWAKLPHAPSYRALYGILLDMVGARGARFYWEYYSKRSAAPIVRELWDTARQLGWSSYFVPRDGAGILDDHLPVIEHRGIPSVDIVNYNPEGAFGPHWHTHADDLANIDRETLKAVGQTVITMVERKHPSL